MRQKKYFVLLHPLTLNLRHNVRLLGDHQFTFVDEALDNQLSLTEESEISFGLEILAEGQVLNINDQLTIELIGGDLVASTGDGDQKEIDASFMEDGKFHLVVIRNDDRGENALIEVSKYSIDDSDSERDFEIMQLNSSIQFRNVFNIIHPKKSIESSRHDDHGSREQFVSFYWGN